MSLTSQQHRLLTFLAERMAASGICPSTTEIMDALGIKGRGTVHESIGILQERGYVRRLFRGRARCIEILRLPDDVSQSWLHTVSTGSMVRELMRRGVSPQTRPGYVLCPGCGHEGRDDEVVTACPDHRRIGRPRAAA